MLEKIKNDFKTVSYRVYIVFLLCLLISVFATACVSGVGPSKRFVETSYKNANLLFPVAISLIENVDAETLAKSIQDETIKQSIKSATSNGVQIYKTGLIRKFKNWRFDIEKQREILQTHEKKIEKE